MRPSTFLVMGLAALAVAKAFPSEDTVAKVKIQSIPSKVSKTGAVSVPVSEVISKSKKVGQTPAEDRIWHTETTTTPPPPHGWGWGWPAPADDHPWAPTPEPYVAPSSTAAPYTPAFSGPFAFQLGAYYNPFIPVPVESPPAYPHYPPAPGPRPTQYANYGHSPVIRQPSAYAPAPTPYTPHHEPAPYTPHAPAPYTHHEPAPYVPHAPAPYTPHAPAAYGSHPY